MGDTYRTFLHGDAEKNTKWRFGAPPNYDVVNKLFEEGRTKVPVSSLCLCPVKANISARNCEFVDINLLYSAFFFFFPEGMASGFDGGEGADSPKELGNGTFPQGRSQPVQINRPREIYF